MKFEKEAKELIGKWGYEEEYWWKPIAELAQKVELDSQSDMREDLVKWVEKQKKVRNMSGEKEIVFIDVDDILIYLNKIK